MRKKFNQFLNNISMRTKILVAFVLLLLLVVACLLFSFLYLANSDAKKNMLYSANTALTQTKSFLDFKAESVRNIMNIFSANDVLQDTLKTPKSYYENNVGIWQIDCDALESQFYTIQSTPDITNISIYMEEGPASYLQSEKLLSIAEYSTTDFYNSYSFSSRKLSWHKGSDFISASSPDNIIVLKNIVSQNNYQDTIGIIRLEFANTIFSDILNQGKPSQNTLAFLADSNSIMAHSDFQTPDDSILLANAYEYIRTLSANNAYPYINEPVTINNQSYILCMDTINRTNWKLILLIPFADIQLSASSTITIAIYLSIVVFVLAIFVTLFLSNNFTKRLSALSRQMHKIDDSSLFFEELSPASKDEIGILSQNFNYMLFKISTLLDEKYQLGQEAKNAELIALQEQINPHFLYNTLDQIYWLGVKNSIPEVSNLVLKLSKFYRLSLSKGKNMVSLQNELEHIQAYVDIQNFRYDDMITLITDIEPDALSFALPKITLQPIVENAILHGICEKDEPGTITITARKTDEHFILSVTDDGDGMDEETRSSLFADVPASQGYGMKNIMKRLKLIYNQRADIFVESTLHVGTTVTIQINICD